MSITKEEIIAKYVKRYGKKAEDMLNWLGKEKIFIDAMATELGQQILSSHIDMANDSFNNFRNSIPDNEDITKLNTKTIIALAEYNTCVKIVTRVSKRIAEYKKAEVT